MRIITNKSAITASLLLSLLLCMPAAAEDKDILEQAEIKTQLDTVKVTSGRLEQELQDVPMSVSVISAEYIENNPQTGIQDYLRDVPGVHVSQTPYGKYIFSIRGYDNDRVVLLINGIRQNSASALLSEESGGLEIDASEIERIEVIKGPASALYGSDAVGGVINIITKKSSDKLASFTIGGTYDTSITAFTPRFSASGTAENGINYRVSTSHVKAHDRKLPDNETFDYSDYEKETYSGLLGYNWSKGRVALLADYYSGSNKMPTTDGREQKMMYGHNYLEYTRDKRTTVTGNLSLDDLTKNLVQFNATVYYQKLESHLDSVGDASESTMNSTAYPYVFGIDENYAVGGTIQANWSFFDSHLLITGVDYEYSHMESTGDYVGLRANTNAILDEDRKGYAQNIAVFAQDEWSIFNSLALTVGLRYTNNTIELTDDKTFPEREGKETDNNVVGNIGLVYRGIDNLALRAIYSQGYRSPSLTDKFMGNTQRYMPNPDLDPEKSYNYELGARYYNGIVTVDVGGFYSELKDAFSGVDTGIPHPAGRNYFKVENVEKAKSFGTEANASVFIEPLGLTPYGSMTWMRYQYNYATGLKTFDSGRPEMWGTFGIKWEHNIVRDLLFYSDLSMTMSDGYKTQNSDGSYSANNHFKSGKQLNLALGVRGGEEHKYQVALNLRNLLDDPYEPDGYFTPGFHAILGASYTW